MRPCPAIRSCGLILEIKTIAVIGVGGVGREIALAALLGGYRVILEDVSASRLERVAESLAGKAGLKGEELGSRLVLTSAVEEAVREADLILEAVADEEEMKIEMFTIFDKFARPGAILASTSTTLPIADLAAVTFCPERCIGWRFISTDGKPGTVELIRTAETSEATIAACREVARRMGKEILTEA